MNAVETHQDVDLRARDKPAPQPCSIQPHGALLVIEPISGNIVQASTTASSFFGLSTEQLIGQHWDALLDVGSRALPSAEAVTAPLHLAHAPVKLLQRAASSSTSYVAAWHLEPGRWLIEIEPAETQISDTSVQDVLPTLRQIAHDTTVVNAAVRVARELHTSLGYDRVMVYRFDSDWNGEVIAEAKLPQLESYLGLHCPAADVPPQARALYLRNRVRHIADVDSQPSPIEPATGELSQQQLDLSDVSLRSVSPLYLGYLANMGVSATLVISVVVNGALWGLIACHHHQPLFANHVMRDVASKLTTALAMRIGALQAMERARGETVLLTIREKLITAFDEDSANLVEMLADMAPALMDMVDADGIALFYGEEMISRGRLPTPEHLANIRTRLQTDHGQIPHAGTVTTLHTDKIGSVIPALADLEPLAAGFIFMPLATRIPIALLWTRREQVQTVNWAGNPQLTNLPDIADVNLSPRKTFQRWQETVRGRSRPWFAQQLQAARSLGVLIKLLERKRDHPQLSVLEVSLAHLRQAAAIIELGPAGIARVIFANDAFAHATDADGSALIGLTMAELLDACVPTEQLAQLENQFLKRAPESAVLALRVANADPEYWQFDFEALPACTGQCAHWLLRLRQPD